MQGLLADGNHLLVRTGTEFLDSDFALLVWDAKRPHEPAVKIGGTLPGSSPVGFPFEQIKGDYVSWMSATSKENRRILLYRISTRKVESVAEGLVYRPQFVANSLVWQYQDKSDAAKLKGIDLATGSLWQPPPALASMNANSQTGYVIGPEGVAWGTQVENGKETDYQLWAWRNGWRKPLLVEQAGAPQDIMAWHGSILAYRSGKIDGGFVINLANGVATQANTGWASLEFDGDELVAATASGTEQKRTVDEVRILISALPTTC